MSEYFLHRLCDDCLKKGKHTISEIEIDGPYQYVDSAFSEPKLIRLKYKFCNECNRKRKGTKSPIKGEKIYIGIVGSRRFKGKRRVKILVKNSCKDFWDSPVIVSGGCKGPDTWAEEEAKKQKFETLIFFPKIRKGMNQYEIIDAYYKRNKKIAENSDVIHAFVVDNKGGTWNTIKYARQLKKKVIIHMEG